jgi:hypothetical protein
MAVLDMEMLAVQTDLPALIIIPVVVVVLVQLD